MINTGIIVNTLIAVIIAMVIVDKLNI